MSISSLSVCMANYNHAQYIGEALESILNQTFRPKEIIIVDDGSTDNSVAVIKEFANRNPIIHLVCNKKNRGAVFSQNLALNLASSDYIYTISCDDKVLPGLFEKSMGLLAQYPQAGLCCSDLLSFNDRSSVVSEYRLRWNDNACYFPPDKLASVIRGGYIAGNTAVIKRSALLEIGGLISGLRWHCDWFALHVIGFRYGVCYIPEILSARRLLLNSYSTVGRRQWLFQREVLEHLLYLLKLPVYCDVLSLFQRSGIMSHFGTEIIRVVLGNSRHWDFQSIKLIRRPLQNEAKRIFKNMLRLITPLSVKQMYRHFRNL